MKHIKLLASFPILIVALLSGCATTPSPETISGYMADARDLAAAGTAAALLENPNLRSDLMIARDALSSLEAMPADHAPTAEDLVAALSKLPFKKLQSPKGIIYVTAGKIVVRRFLSWLPDKSADVAALGYVRQFAGAFRQGIDDGLNK